MCVPDLMNICEIMLSAEGFIEAKDLAKKFVTLYRLNKQLLSAQVCGRSGGSRAQAAAVGGSQGLLNRSSAIDCRRLE